MPTIVVYIWHDKPNLKQKHIFVSLLAIVSLTRKIYLLQKSTLLILGMDGFDVYFQHVDNTYKPDWLSRTLCSFDSFKGLYIGYLF